MNRPELYMQRCLKLASLGLPSAMPNPSVGAVLVYKDRIIGEGYTSPYGGSHGEVNCINSVREIDKKFISHSQLYVSLEPCSHFGKTPPCTNLIVEKKIPEVIIGCVDTFSKVAGRGIKRLQEHGINVTVGVLEEECRELNKRFFTFYEKRRPYIILKWAQTQDGFVAPLPSLHAQNRWITGEQSSQWVHKMRSMEMAILVGKNTVLTDNPNLTTRNYPGDNPVRVIFDNKLELWKDRSLFSIFNDEARTIVINSLNDFQEGNCQGVKLDFTRELLNQVVDYLQSENIQSLIVEGGPYTLNSFIEENLWDEAVILTGNKKFVEGVKAPRWEYHPNNDFFLGEDNVKQYKRIGE